MFINQTETIGQIITAGTNNITGSIIGTLLLIVIILFAFSIMFGIPIEISSLIFFPIFMVFAAYYSTVFWTIIGLIIFMWGWIIAKNFIFR